MATKKLTKGEVMKAKVQDIHAELFKDIQSVVSKHGLKANVTRLALAIQSDCLPPCQMKTHIIRDASGRNVSITDCVC